MYVTSISSRAALELPGSRMRLASRGLATPVIDKCFNEISKFLLVLFNKIISHQKIPKHLKISEKIPIPKPGEN
jgi:hypothetical protein